MQLLKTYKLGEGKNTGSYNSDMLDQCGLSYSDHVLFEVHPLLAFCILLHPHAPIGCIVGCKVRSLAVLELILCPPCVFWSACAVVTIAFTGLIAPTQL